MIWTAYADEAGLGDYLSPIGAMAGFLASEESWTAFDVAWANLLTAHGLSYLDMDELTRRKKAFHGWSDRRHNEFLLGAHELISKYLGAGFVALMRKSDFRDLYKPGAGQKRLIEDTPYGVLFRACVSFCLGILAAEYGEEVKGKRFDFVVDQRGKIADARRLYDILQHDSHSDPIMTEMLGPVIGLAGKESSPGCQVAGLLLDGAYRQAKMEHGKTPSLPIEKSAFARPDIPVNRNEIPIFRLPLGREVLESLRAGLFMDAEASRKFSREALEQGRLRRS
jgi:hypothetical protein